MLRGTVEDITTTQPVAFSAMLEELPWQEGAASHYSIQSTPYGLVWLAADRTVKIYNGTGEPDEISTAVTDILRDMTIGIDANARSAYLNYADRDWYVLAIATGGSARLNKLLIFDIDPDPDSNCGIFILDLTTLTNPINIEDVGVVEDSQGSRILAVSGNGQLWAIKYLSSTSRGINLIPTSTDGSLQAYWHSGLAGNDTSQSVKIFRRGKLVTDQEGFRVLVSISDDERYTLQNPRIVDLGKVALGKFTINWKGKRASVLINFPDKDMDCSLMELTLTSKVLSNR